MKKIKEVAIKPRTHLVELLTNTEYGSIKYTTGTFTPEMIERVIPAYGCSIAILICGKIIQMGRYTPLDLETNIPDYEY